MPIYEYICQECGEETEIIQKISDSPLKECPVCGKSSLKKKTSVSSFHLKGSGWYKDGYSGKSAEKITEKKSDSKADSKVTPEKDKKEGTSKSGSGKKISDTQKKAPTSKAS